MRLTGVEVNLDADHMFLKDAANPPSCLSGCATPSAWTRTTVRYESGTRGHIEKDLGYDIVANLGDQYCDLDGGYADRTYKLPKPTYFGSWFCGRRRSPRRGVRHAESTHRTPLLHG